MRTSAFVKLAAIVAVAAGLVLGTTVDASADNQPPATGTTHAGSATHTGTLQLLSDPHPVTLPGRSATSRAVTLRAGTVGANAETAATAYEIINDNSGLCAEVYHSSTANLGNVDQYTCNGTNTQLWIDYTNSGLDQYVNYNSGLCAEVYHSSTANLGNVDQYACNGTATQYWY